MKEGFPLLIWCVYVCVREEWAKLGLGEGEKKGNEAKKMWEPIRQQTTRDVEPVEREKERNAYE